MRGVNIGELFFGGGGVDVVCLLDQCKDLCRVTVRLLIYLSRMVGVREKKIIFTSPDPAHDAAHLGTDLPPGCTLYGYLVKKYGRHLASRVMS